MIKKLSKKLLLVFSTLAVVIFTVSSCYAALNFRDVPEECNITNLKNKIIEKGGYDAYSEGQFIYIFDSSSSTNRWYIEVYNDFFDSWTFDDSNNSMNYNKKTDYTSNRYIRFIFDESTSSFYTEFENYTCTALKAYFPDSYYIGYSSIPIYDKSGAILYEPITVPPATFDYTFKGIDNKTVRVDISNLDSSYKIYGYVDLVDNEFLNIGDTLDTSLYSDKLRLFDFNGLYCHLYKGEILTCYVVDSNNAICNVVSIDDMAIGYFLFGYPHKNKDGIDFTLLYNGETYYSDSLTFKYSYAGNLITSNNVIKPTYSDYIKYPGYLSQFTIKGQVYLGSNVVAEYSEDIRQNLSSFSSDYRTGYREYKKLLKTYCVFEIPELILTGFDSNGDVQTFLGYKVKWSVPSGINFSEILINGTNQTSRYGYIDSTVSGVIYPDIEIHISSDEVIPFIITLEFYDSNNNLIDIKKIQSVEIYQEQVKNESDNLTPPDYDLGKNPNYSSGSGVLDYNNVMNWQVNDYVKFLGTDNTMFNFFWAFLNNMPAWISTPLTILLIGLVVVTIYKFIRG